MQLKIWLHEHTQEKKENVYMSLSTITLQYSSVRENQKNTGYPFKAEIKTVDDLKKSHSSTMSVANMQMAKTRVEM